jgi:hypothetical protein
MEVLKKRASPPLITIRNDSAWHPGAREIARAAFNEGRLAPGDRSIQALATAIRLRSAGDVTRAESPPWREQLLDGSLFAPQ